MVKHQSARTLLWLSFILLLIGGTIIDPAASFALTALAGLSALVAIALGSKRCKLIGLLMLAVSIGMAISYWPAAKSHQGKYQERINNAAVKR